MKKSQTLLSHVGKSHTGSAKSHTGLVHDILLAIGSRRDLRVWKNQTGVAIAEDRVIRFGLVGSADILGIMAPNGRLLAIECKTGSGRQSKEQKNFQAMIDSLGGLYILARSVNDVTDALHVDRLVFTPQF